MRDIERVLHDRRHRRGADLGQARTLLLPAHPAVSRAATDRADDAPSAGADGVVLTLTDISALEQARAKLAQLSAIVESSDDAIVSKTLDGIITSWNNGAARLYGYSRRRSDRPPRQLPAGRPGRKDEIDAVAAAGPRRPARSSGSNTTHVRKDGSRVDVSVTFSPILERRRRRSSASRRSRATSRSWSRARKEIAEREERIRLLLDSTAEAIYGIDLNGVCIFCNAACARLLGYDSPAALIGKQMHPLIHHTRPDGTPYPPEQSLDLSTRCATASRRTSTTRCCGAPTARRSRPSTGAIRSSATTR